ncbi:UNVERIFIED_CONTAM: hypothetical protein PYX00_005372 [Menopon gallinae]|uniref:Mab-21-like HhH/H2TH-like domain-containing protein n=1 Tax=Menopon gallinae TaxID=328185 RepID=A0AAW2HSB8_9NEOP
MDESSESERLFSGDQIYESSIFIEEDAKDKEEISNLRRSFMEDFDMFLLNNILMSVQFFENYDRDILEVRKTCLEEQFIGSDHFRAFEADSLHELVAKNVTFKKNAGSTKVVEILHPLRTYVCYNNVEVSWSSNIQMSPKKNIYKLTAQKCEDDKKETAGYVNLIEQELSEEWFETPSSRQYIQHPDNNILTSNDGADKIKMVQADKFIAKNDNFYYLEPGKRSKPYPLHTYRTEERITTPSFIPKSCFKECHKQNLMNQNRRVGFIQMKLPTQNIRKMLISAAFKRHFSEVFISELWKSMGYAKVKLDDATFHLDHIVLRKGHSVHHIIPVLEMEWARSEREFSYQDIKPLTVVWPPASVEETITKIGHYLVPTGYYEASEEDNDYTLEWKIEIPKAEKYLAMHMLHTHVRCYLFALILHKSFIQTDLSSIHFGPSHILNLLFSVVRKTCRRWPEYSQGETLMNFLKALQYTLKKKALKSFFFPQRNLYANSPLKTIHKAQTIISRIIQNPIPYVLKALLNLQYKEEFYPALDYLELYDILTKKPSPPSSQREKARKQRGKKKKEEPIPVEKKIVIEEEKLLTPANTPPVRIETLKMFINHFIEIASQSRQYQWYEYSMLYLVHAKRLTDILREEILPWGIIQDFTERIKHGMKLSKSNISINYTPTKNLTGK